MDEKTINDLLAYIDTRGFTAHGFITETNFRKRPLGIHLTMQYKTGDGCDRPYADSPPDDLLLASLTDRLFETDGDGSMFYHFWCEQCQMQIQMSEVAWINTKMDGKIVKCLRCPHCMNWLNEVCGFKWIYGRKNITLKGSESDDEICRIIERVVDGEEYNEIWSVS